MSTVAINTYPVRYDTATVDGVRIFYRDELSVTGLTSNPTIFDHAMRNGAADDASITEGARRGLSHEIHFFEIALAELTLAADLFRPVYERTAGVDGWGSLEVSPLLAHSTKATITEAQRLRSRLSP